MHKNFIMLLKILSDNVIFTACMAFSWYCHVHFLKRIIQEDVCDYFNHKLTFLPNVLKVTSICTFSSRL